MPRARRNTPRTTRWVRRPEARPQELLDAALRVFAERGYRNTRLDEVAAAAGVTKGAFYHYFTTKEELLRRALDQYQERTLGRLDGALEGVAETATARLSAVVRRAFEGTDPARSYVLQLLQGLANEVPAVYHRWLATGPVSLWRRVAALIEQGKASGEFRADVDSTVAARLLVSGLVTQLVWQRHASHVSGLAIERPRLIDGALDVLLAGLRPTAAPARRKGAASSPRRGRRA